MPDPVPAVPDLTRQTTYSPVASAGPFSVDFDIYGNGTDYGAWVRVILDDVELEAVTDYVLTSATGPVATIARPITDAQVAPVSGTWTGDLVIVGRERPRRSTQLEEGRGVSARDFNLIASKFTVQAREFFDRMEAAEAAIVSGLPEPDASKAVLVDRVQTFTDAEKSRARDNIGLADSLFATVAAVEAATIDADVDVIQTSSYYAGNNAGGARYFRAASEPSHGGKIQSDDGAWWELDTSEGVFPTQWGAYGDGDLVTRHNDTAAINLALDYIRDQDSSTLQARKYFLDGQSRIYYVTGSLDATLIRARHNWGIRNLALYAACAGKVVLDLTGSRYGYFQNIFIYGDETNTPASGIQQCRANIAAAFPAAGSHTFVKVETEGHFTRAALHNYASEQCVYMHCVFVNERDTTGGAEAWTAIFDGEAQKTVQSDFTTVATGAQAFNGLHLFGCNFLKGAGDGDSMFFTGGVGHEFQRCYWTANAGYAGVVINMDDTSRDLVLDGHFEPEPDECIRFVGTGDKTIYGLKVRDHSPHCTQQVFGISGLTSVTIYDLDLRVKNWNAGSLVNSVFEDHTKFSLKNFYIDVPDQPSMGDVTTFISFIGHLRAQNITPGRTFGVIAEGSDPLTVVWRDDSATAMNVDISKFSNSAAASDGLTNLRFKGNDSGGTQATYVALETSIEDPTDGSEDGKFLWKLLKAGVSTIVATFSALTGITFSQDTAFTSGTASTTTGTGAVKVTGGIGATGAVNAGGAIKTTDATASTTTATGSGIFGGGVGVAGAANIGGNIAGAGSILSSSASGGIGYATGAGNAVTQATNRTTAVTINTPTGRITTNNTSLAAGAAAKFTVNNSSVVVSDNVCVSIRSATTTDFTRVRVQGISNGSFDIVVENGHSATAETGAILIHFSVIKSVVG